MILPSVSPALMRPRRWRRKAACSGRCPPTPGIRRLGALPAPVVAALIEGDPEQNTALIANLPAAKYRQVINLGTPAQGRAWLERAVGSGTLAGSILPSLMTGSDLADMLVTDPGVRRALPRLLNFERAERWRQLLTTNEWHKNIDELLMADTDELLKARVYPQCVRQSCFAVAAGLCA